MGVFHDMVTVVNRAPIKLAVTFDGQSTDIPPGESQLPKFVVPYAKNQNPVMGTQDPDNPHMSGGEYLVGVKAAPGSKQKDNIEPLTPEEWAEHLRRPLRMDEKAMFADVLQPRESVIVRGKGRKTQAKSSFDAGVRVTQPEDVVGDE